MLQQLEDKMKEITQKLEQSAANHNFLIGSLQTVKEIYEAAMAVAPALEAVDPAITPVVDAVEAVASVV